MNGNSKRGLLSLGLDDLSAKDKAGSWKPFLMSILLSCGIYGLSMVLIWWLVG